MTKGILNIIHRSEVSEKAIERYLCDMVRRAGGVCLKYTNPGMTGYPDRVVVMPNGVTIWVELKSKGKKPGKVQKIRIESMRKLGHRVYVIDSKQGVDLLMSEL